MMFSSPVLFAHCGGPVVGSCNTPYSTHFCVFELIHPFAGNGVPAFRRPDRRAASLSSSLYYTNHHPLRTCTQRQTPGVPACRAARGPICIMLFMGGSGDALAMGA